MKGEFDAGSYLLGIALGVISVLIVVVGITTTPLQTNDQPQWQDDWVCLEWEEAHVEAHCLIRGSFDIVLKTSLEDYVNNGTSFIYDSCFNSDLNIKIFDDKCIREGHTRRLNE